jgi:hypothetical protein
MLKKFFSLIVVLATATSLHAQEFGNSDNPSLFNTRFISDQYKHVFSVSPALLSCWQYGNWSNIGLSYSHEQGDFRNAQSHDNHSAIQIQTESFHSLPASGWTFYGLFRYANGGADSIGNNLSYHPPRNGSPYYLFTQRSGVWKMQNYEFNVQAAKQLNDRLSYGAKILYLGNLAYRYNDTRNNQPGLYNELALSVSYKLNEHILGAGAEYQRNKTRPQLNNKYPQNTYDEIYNIYINGGMGTYLRTLLSNVNFTFEGSSFGAILQWMHQKGDNRYAASYKASFGDEFFIKRERLVQSVENKLLDYKYHKHNVSLSGLHALQNAYLTSHINLTHISGEGFRWRENIRAYQSNYLADITDVVLNTALYQPHSIMHKAGVSFGLHAEDRFDKAYGYVYNYSMLTAGGDVELAFPLQQSRLLIGAGGHFQLNLNLEHNPGASENSLYTQHIGYQLMAFQTTDYLRLPVFIELQMPMENNMLQFQLAAEPLIPVTIHYPQHTSFAKGDSFLSMVASVKLFF